MALFKIFKGNETAKLTDSNATGYRVPTDGYAYYDTSTKLFYIDADYDGNGTIKRYPINAASAWADSLGNVIKDTYLPLTGGTVTGQIKTSFKSSVAMGTYYSSQTTIPNLIDEVRYSSGCGGSVNTTEAYTLNNVTIPAGWYNFFYIPHRSGGINGVAHNDNCNYGVLYLHRMNSNNYQNYIISFSASAIQTVTLTSNFKTAITSGQVLISDGTTGSIKTSGFTIGVSVPSNAVFTDIKQNITLATTSKAYLTGVTTTPTSSAQALTGVADTGVYLTSTAGEISAVRHSFNVDGTEKAYMVFNNTTNAIDFIFNDGWNNRKVFTFNIAGNLTLPAKLVCANSSNTTGGSYTESGLEIREYNYGLAQSDTWGNAPRMTFHWGGRVQAQIGLASDGWLYTTSGYGGDLTTNPHRFVIEQGGTWNIGISGNAATATKANGLVDGTSTMTSAYNKAGLNYADYTWLAGWNGYELRAVNKSQFAQASHSHAYLPLAGGTMNDEKAITFQITRKKDGGGGWAYTPIRMIGNNNAMFFNIGVYGSANTLDYAYIGANNWDSTANTRIYADGHLTAPKVYGAVWNDYAEYRKDNPNENQEPGRCIKELGDGSLALTTKRLERGCEIVSDTFGFAIGEDEENGYNTPIASNGRVLAYPYESIEEFANHIGWPVCSGPNGTVSIMTEEEEEKYPSRIIGTISEIPTYEEWGTGKVKVDGRVWIRIK